MPLEQLESFMQAIMGQESGGDANITNSSTGAHGLFQIMPANWEPWSKETFGFVAPKTSQNQYAVAQKKMSDYYKQFGDWDSVAIAWFAGPGAAEAYNNGDQSVLYRSDGYSTVQEYLEKYRNSMANGTFAMDPFQGLELGDADPNDLNDPGQTLINVFDALTEKIAGGERVDLDDAQLALQPDTLQPFDFARTVAGDMVDGSSSAVQQVMGDLGQAGLYAALAQPGDLGVPDTAKLDFDPGEVNLDGIPADKTGNAVVDIASGLLGVPYKWGGTNPNIGLDCSGLVQLVYKQIGIDLPRVSRDQANAGVAVDSLAEAKPGDLISFGNPVHHIGIYIGNGKILHAPRTGRNVSIDSIWENPTSIRRITSATVKTSASMTTNVDPSTLSSSGSSGQPSFGEATVTGEPNVPAPQVAPPREVEQAFGSVAGGSANRPL